MVTKDTVEAIAALAFGFLGLTITDWVVAIRKLIKQRRKK